MSPRRSELDDAIATIESGRVEAGVAMLREIVARRPAEIETLAVALAGLFDRYPHMPLRRLPPGYRDDVMRVIRCVATGQ